MLDKTEKIIKNVQSTNIDNIGQTRLRTKKYMWSSNGQQFFLLIGRKSCHPYR